MFKIYLWKYLLNKIFKQQGIFVYINQNLKKMFTCSYKIQADIINNRLYLIMRGYLVDEYVKRAVVKTIEEVEKLRSGFDLINDISELKPATDDDARRLQRVKGYVLGRGVNRLVEVVKISERESRMKSAERNVGKTKNDPIFVSSVDEAEKFLSE